MESLALNGTIVPVSAVLNGTSLRLRFDRTEVSALLEPGADVLVAVSGTLRDATPFIAEDSISVLRTPEERSSDPPVLEGPQRPALTSRGTAFHLNTAPNPFNPATTVQFGTAEPGRVEVVVYDLAGRHVRTLAAGYLNAGDHEQRWDGRDESGRSVASGIYLCRLQAGGVQCDEEAALGEVVDQ